MEGVLVYERERARKREHCAVTMQRQHSSGTAHIPNLSTALNLNNSRLYHVPVERGWTLMLFLERVSCQQIPARSGWSWAKPSQPPPRAVADTAPDCLHQRQTEEEIVQWTCLTHETDLSRPSRLHTVEFVCLCGNAYEHFVACVYLCMSLYLRIVQWGDWSQSINSLLFSLSLFSVCLPIFLASCLSPFLCH